MSQEKGKTTPGFNQDPVPTGKTAVEEEAKQLFVHGLLRYRASKRTRPQKEAHIARILDAIREPGSPSPIPLAGKILLLAASLLAILFVGRFFFLGSDPQLLEAELLTHTLEKSRNDIHYFKGSFLAAPRGRRVRRGFEAYFGPNKAFAIRILRRRGPLTFGSDGKRYWIKARNGFALDLPFVPKDGFPLLGAGNDLSYLEIRPLLESLLVPGTKSLTHNHEGNRIHLQGFFIFPEFFKKHPLARLAGAKGHFDLWIDKESSMIQRAILKVVDDPTRNLPPFQLRLDRRPSPPINDPSTIFSPKRVYLPPSLKMAIWGANLLRRIQKRRLSRKPRVFFRRRARRR